MSPIYRAALDRAGRESAEKVRSAAVSNEDSANHILQSRDAVHRSLRLLKDTSPARTD